MNAAARDYWQRALEALDVAQHDLNISADAAASRAYYAAFYAVSALFALQERSFAKHSGVEAALHRELVKPGVWETDLGRGYSRLAQLRTRGDYGGGRHVLQEEGEEAIGLAARILAKVSASNPEAFPLPA